MSTRRFHALLIALCVVGLAASATAAYVHYRLLADPGYTSFCDVSASINCESVYRSAYGSVAGVPVALLGVLWFALALLLTFVSNPRGGEQSDTSSYLFVLSTAALAVVLYLAYASFFVVKSFCILCAVTYVAVIGIFILSGAASSAKLSSLPGMIGRDMRRLARHPVALVIAIAYLTGAASAITFLKVDDVVVNAAPSPPEAPAGQVLPQEQRASFEQWLDAQPRVPLTIPSDGARVVIVKFNDYQCPPCRQTFLEYKPILAKYRDSNPGQVKFVTKDFPLEAECNTGGAHVAACEAAAAVRLARLKNRADDMEDWLFQNQASMSPDLVRQGLAKIAGVSDFDAQYPRLLEQVRADAAFGRQLGVSRTPTFFINGVKVEGGLRPEYFDAAIAHELKRAATAAEKP